MKYSYFSQIILSHCCRTFFFGSIILLGTVTMQGAYPPPQVQSQSHDELQQIDEEMNGIKQFMITGQGLHAAGFANVKCRINALLRIYAAHRELIYKKIESMKAEVEEDLLGSSYVANSSEAYGNFVAFDAFINAIQQVSISSQTTCLTATGLSTPALQLTDNVPAAYKIAANACATVAPERLPKAQTCSSWATPQALPTTIPTSTANSVPTYELSRPTPVTLPLSSMPYATSPFVNLPATPSFLHRPVPGKIVSSITTPQPTPTPMPTDSSRATTPLLGSATPLVNPVSSQEQAPNNIGIADIQGRRPTMEDAHVYALSPDGRFEYCAVYDGHGGNNVSHVLAQGSSNLNVPSLHDFIFKSLASITDNDDEVSIAKILKTAVKEFDGEFQKHRNTFERDGSTAIAVLWDKKNSILFFINLGDSRALVCTDQGQMAPLMRFEEGAFVSSFPTTQDHKPDTDRTAIENAGHDVFFGRLNGVLAVSRAFGDLECKFRGEDLDEKMIDLMTNADIYLRKINPDDSCVLLACDGLWDLNNSGISNEEIVRRLIDLKNNQNNTAQQAAADLVDFAYKKWSMDNISSIVIYLK